MKMCFAGSRLTSDWLDLATRVAELRVTAGAKSEVWDKTKLAVWSNRLHPSWPVTRAVPERSRVTRPGG